MFFQELIPFFNVQKASILDIACLWVFFSNLKCVLNSILKLIFSKSIVDFGLKGQNKPLNSILIYSRFLWSILMRCSRHPKPPDSPSLEYVIDIVYQLMLLTKLTKLEQITYSSHLHEIIIHISISIDRNHFQVVFSSAKHVRNKNVVLKIFVCAVEPLLYIIIFFVVHENSAMLSYLRMICGS